MWFGSLLWRLIMGKNTKNKNMFRKNNERNLKKKRRRRRRQERWSTNLFCFDVFSYKESTRKIQKMIRK